MSIKSSGMVNERIREKSEHRRKYHRRARGNKRTVSDVRGLERIVSIIPIKRAKSRRNRSSGTRDMTATSPPLMGRQVGKIVEFIGKRVVTLLYQYKQVVDESREYTENLKNACKYQDFV